MAVGDTPTPIRITAMATIPAIRTGIGRPVATALAALALARVEHARKRRVPKQAPRSPKVIVQLSSSCLLPSRDLPRSTFTYGIRCRKKARGSNARRFKSYQTSLGFFDLAIAAPSMKAAADAWGSRTNLFQQGLAKETHDAAIVAATMAKPGVVLRRPVGSNGPFTEHAALPKDLPVAKVKERPAKARPRIEEPARKPDDKAARAASLAFEKEQKRRERARQKEEAAREKERKLRDQAIAKAERALEQAKRAPRNEGQGN